MSAQWPLVPTTHDEPVQAGGVLWPCPVCNLPIPVGVEVTLIRDDEGDDALWTEPNMADLELHAMTHDNETIANTGWSPESD